MKLRTQLFGSFLCVIGVMALSACGRSDDEGFGDDKSNAGIAGFGGEEGDSVQPGDPTEGGGGSSGDPGTGSGTVGGAAGEPSDPPPVMGTPCGPNVCGEGEVCCNESCGICTPPDGFCTEQYCGPIEEPPPDCSGISALCIVGTYWSVEACACVPVEEPPPGCGIEALCIEGSYWSVEACACVPVEEPPPDCSRISALCIVGTYWSVEACACVPVEEPPVAGTPCGPSVCGEGEVCCNESCGICTPPDGFCTDQLCGPIEPPPDCSGILALCIQGTYWSVEQCACVAGTPCGPSVCGEGEVCCNESCGICTPPDGFCTMQFCGEQPPAAECSTDADCALVEDYCGGCNCLALPDTADAPTCADPVQCFAPACMNKAAACVNGVCTVVSQ